MALTSKQVRFVEEYLVDLNATKAAIRAGYSKRSAQEIGYEQLKKPDVAEAISAAQAARSARTKIDADWVLRRLVEEADADANDIFDEHGAVKPIKDWPPIWRKGLLTGMDVEELRVDGDVVGLIRKPRFSERIKRLELIGKHVGVQAFRERLEHTGPNGGPIETVTRIELVAPKTGGGE